MQEPFTFYEFFAGGGMVRAGLGDGWQCLFANDMDPKKASAYAANYGSAELSVGDVATVVASQLKGRASLAWGSFPCQDLSLAGKRAGLHGDRSGAFFPFWDKMRALVAEGRAPRMIVLENVIGASTGPNIATICGLFQASGYRVGAVEIDAAHWLPQSRRRLFIIGAHESVAIPASLMLKTPPSPLWASDALRTACRGVADWVWWNLPRPSPRHQRLEDLIETSQHAIAWDDPAKTEKLLGMMSDANRAKVSAALAAGAVAIGTVYKRTRVEHGSKVQRAEPRFDGLAGCLRTPGGGSSRQTVLVVEGNSIRSRLMSARETARLMGLPDSYMLPSNYTDACHLTGDGVAVPVVRYLAEHLFEPLLAGVETSKAA